MKVIVVTLSATLAIQLGYFLWKLALDSMPKLEKASAKVPVTAFLRNRLWISGTCSAAIGWLLFVKAADIGQVSFVQPLMSVGDVFLVGLAVLFLHERLQRREWIGLVVTILGAALLSTEAEEVAAAAIRWSPMVATSGAGALICAALVVLGMRSDRPELPLAAAVGVAFGIGAILTKLMTSYIADSGQRLESAAFALNPVLPFMVAANFAGLGLLQVAFRHGRASIVIPVQLAVLNVVVVLGGVLVFAESVSGLRLFSVLLILAGTAVLHSGTKSAPA